MSSIEHQRKVGDHKLTFMRDQNTEVPSSGWVSHPRKSSVGWFCSDKLLRLDSRTSQRSWDELPRAVQDAANAWCRFGRTRPESKTVKYKRIVNKIRSDFSEAMRNENCRHAFQDLDDLTYSAGRYNVPDAVGDMRRRRAFANKCLVRGDRKRTDEVLRGVKEDRRRGEKLYASFKQAMTDPNPNRCEIAFDVLMEGRENAGKIGRRSFSAERPSEADMGLFANACVLRKPRSLPTPARVDKRPIELDGSRRRRSRRR